MTVILVVTMLVAFLAVESFTHKPASEYGVQTALRIEAESRNAQPIVAGYDIPEQRGIHKVRAGIDRRQIQRRGRGDQSAA